MQSDTQLLEDLTEGLSEIKTHIQTSRKDLADLKTGIGDHQKSFTDLQSSVKTIQDENAKLHTELDKVRRQLLAYGPVSPHVRRPGFVSDLCARQLAAVFIMGNAKAGRLDLLDSRQRETLFTEARSILGLETRAALTTTDIPLPTQFYSEVRELISEFGVARRNMFPFPIGMGTAKPPRFKTRPAFGSIAMSASISEKSPQIEFATLESHKIGGIVRIPREIDDQSIVPMGQFLARYGAIEFARAEDTWAFLADGTATYESVKGITKIATDNSKNVQLAATKTKPSDATLADFRAMRLKVSPAALGIGSKYYLHSTWESQLRTFNTAAEPYVFVPIRPSTRDAVGGPTLDGFPIVWTDVLEPYGTAAALSKYLAVFGVLEYWWFGEHGNPRMDMSSDVYFATDELAARFIEEVDFDYQDVGATSSLQTAAS
jgi:HK97 family phage major capsid protein